MFENIVGCVYLTWTVVTLLALVILFLFFSVRLLSVHLVLVNERCYFYDTIYLSEFQEYRFYIGSIMYVFALRNQYQ